MAQQTTIVAFDGESTPVSHTFVPVYNDVTGDAFEAVWRENNGNLPQAQHPRVTISEETRKSGVLVRKLRIEVPVAESATTAGVEGYTAPPKVAFTPTIEVTYFAHPRDVQRYQRNARQLLINILGGVATSVAPVTGVQVPDFFDSGLRPY
jgi:hypothetical protein